MNTTSSPGKPLPHGPLAAATATPAPATPTVPPATTTTANQPPTWWKRLPPGLLAGILAALVILLLPQPEGLTPGGQRILAVLAFAVIVWLTEAIDYAVSSVLIVAMIAFLLGTAPSAANPEVAVGTGSALTTAMSGFSNSGLTLVGAGLFISVAMTASGLDKRIALRTLAVVGTGARRILIGAIVVTILLSFIVPSATARTACVVPIMAGIIAAFGVDKRSVFAASIMMMVAQATSVWNVGIQTSAAQNLLTVGFMRQMLGDSPSWIEWLVAGAPWAIVMSVALYFLARWLFPPETERIAGGREAMKKALSELGPMSGKEWRLLIVTLCLLGFWSTEKTLHSFDTASTTLVGLSILLLPGIGVMSWKDVQSKAPWGTLVVFGVGIGLGTALLQTKAAVWLADLAVSNLHLETLTPFWIFAALSAFLIVIHLGFASATALTSAMIPIMIAVLQRLGGDINVMGMTMLLGFVVSFGFILPVNAPQNMFCFGTETFTSKQFTRFGLWITAVGYLMLLLFAATWWNYLGLLTKS